MSLVASSEALAHAKALAPKEACGLYVEGGRFVPVPNIAADGAAEFEMPSDAWLAHGRVHAVWHSHPNGQEYPSRWDMAQQQATGVPWIITPLRNGVPLESFTLGGPPPPLLGRVFRHGVTDCWSLLVHWFGQRGIVLEDTPRDHHWWHEGQAILDRFRAYGFVEFDPTKSEPREGDCVIMRMLSGVPNHTAVYLGDGSLLHHLEGRLSRREPVGPWRKRIVRWVRYVGR